MTTGGSGGGEASATVTDEHPHEAGETSDEILESPKNQDGDQWNPSIWIKKKGGHTPMHFKYSLLLSSLI